MTDTKRGHFTGFFRKAFIRPAPRPCALSVLRAILLPASLTALTALCLLFSYSRGEQNAQASNIVSVLRNCKAAAMMYLRDHPLPPPGENHATLLAPYQDDPERFLSEVGNYAFRATETTLWVGQKTPQRLSILHGLTNKSHSYGLYGSESLDIPPASTDAAHRYVMDEVVWLQIR